MLGQQLNLFDDNVKIIEKSGITMFRCSLDFTRWITPGTLCPSCHPSEESAACDLCGSAFEDSRMMIEHMRIGGQVRCDLCLPRVTAADCRDQDVMNCAAEESRLDRDAQRAAAKNLRVKFCNVEE